MQRSTPSFQQGGFVYFDYELHRAASPAAAGAPGPCAPTSLTGWTERMSRPDFRFHHK